MLAQRMMWIAWPAFLVAGVLEMLVFAFVDPQDMQWFGQPIELSRQGVYTLSFLFLGHHSGIERFDNFALCLAI